MKKVAVLQLFLATCGSSCPVRACDLDLDRLCKSPLRHAVAGVRIEREHRVIAGGPGIEQIDGTEVGLIARQREAVRCAAQPRAEVARYRTVAAPELGCA